jgi:hypothetical protein
MSKSKSKGTERLAAERKAALLSAGWRCVPPRYPGEAERWGAPGEPTAWRSLTGAWWMMAKRAIRGAGRP